MSDNAFLNAYGNARRKKHGMGAATRRQGVMLGIMAQFIAWRSPRWLAWAVPLLSGALYSKPKS